MHLKGTHAEIESTRRKNLPLDVFTFLTIALDYNIRKCIILLHIYNLIISVAANSKTFVTLSKPFELKFRLTYSKWSRSKNDCLAWLHNFNCTIAGNLENWLTWFRLWIQKSIQTRFQPMFRLLCQTLKTTKEYFLFLSNYDNSFIVFSERNVFDTINQN